MLFSQYFTMSIHHNDAVDQSLPFTIRDTKDRGKCVVSTRDIMKGDLVLVDSPLLVAPHTKSKPQCLQCARYYQVSVGVCQTCFPV